MVIIILLLSFALALGGQTRPPDNPQNVRTGQATRTLGAVLCWDAFGLVTSTGCTGGGGSGETNAGANLGAGSVVYTGKSGVNLQFRSFTVGSNKLSVTQNTNDIAFDVLPANLLLSSFGGTLNLAQIAQGGATTGQLLQWSGTAWVAASVSGGGGPANTDALAEGSTNLYYTQARARAALSVSGILSYDNGTGVFSCANCANITSTYANPAWISALAWSKITGQPTYQLVSEKGTSNGYAGLGAGGLVPAAQLGSGTANSTTFLRGDGTYSTPSGSVNVQKDAASIGTRPGLNFRGPSVLATDDAGNNRVNVDVVPAMVETAKTADYTVLSTDAGASLTFACASTCAATFPGTPLVNGTIVSIRNLGPSVVNVASSALVDGSASTDLQVGESVLVFSNGTLYRTVAGTRVLPGTNTTVTQSGRSFTVNSTASGGGGGVETFTASGTFTPATGITRVYAQVWAGGGGGGGVNFDASQGGGGGGWAGGWCAVTPGVGVTVTVGTGGAGGIGGAAGGNGVTSSFGSCLSALGGAYGDHGGSNRGAGGKDNAMPLGFNINSGPSLIAYSTTVDQGDVSREDQGGGGRYQGTGSSNGLAGRASWRGGGGGGSSGRGATFLGGAGGTSGYGGAGGTGGGGNGGAPCTAGTAPGGGGGGATENTGSTGTGCAGARGEVRVYY